MAEAKGTEPSTLSSGRMFHIIIGNSLAIPSQVTKCLPFEWLIACMGREEKIRELVNVAVLENSYKVPRYVDLHEPYIDIGDD
jgi:hypothetical protein